jgi:hypothetical protein
MALEGFPQKGDDPPAYSRFIQQLLDDLLDLAAVKPQAVSPDTTVDHHLGFPADHHFVHLFPASGTLAGSFGGRPFRQSHQGSQVMTFGQAKRSKQQIQFSGIEPDAFAVHAVIQLDIRVLDHDHQLTADGAFHGPQPPERVYNRNPNERQDQSQADETNLKGSKSSKNLQGSLPGQKPMPL